MKENTYYLLKKTGLAILVYFVIILIDCFALKKGNGR